MPPAESGGPARKAPAFVRPARFLLYALLFASAALTLTGVPVLERQVREGRQPAAVMMAAPVLLGTFIALFVVYRFALVRSGRYHAGKAFVQVGFMMAVLLLLLPGSLERYRAAGNVRPVDLTRQLTSADWEARAMAAELVQHRSHDDARRYIPRLVELLGDGSPEVRRQARSSLSALAGRDAGGDDPGAAERWRAYWQARGIAFPGL